MVLPRELNVVCSGRLGIFERNFPQRIGRKPKALSRRIMRVEPLAAFPSILSLMEAYGLAVPNPSIGATSPFCFIASRFHEVYAERAA
jgi:hypothetical protein